MNMEKRASLLLSSTRKFMVEIGLEKEASDANVVKFLEKLREREAITKHSMSKEAESWDKWWTGIKGNLKQAPQWLGKQFGGDEKSIDPSRFYSAIGGAGAGALAGGLAQGGAGALVGGLAGGYGGYHLGPQANTWMNQYMQYLDKGKKKVTQ